MDPAKDKAARLGANPALPYLLGCGCLGLILFGIALTIVLSLIPTYLASKADGLSRVNATSMESYLQAKAASALSGRKRAAGTLDDYVGCEFGSSGREQVRQVFRSQCLTNSLVKDFTVSSVEVVYAASGKKKRSVFDREARASDILTYFMKFFVTFDSQCLYDCQTKLGNDIQTCLYNLPAGSMVFTSVPLLQNGVLVYVASQLRTTGIAFVSSILSRMSPFRPGKGPATRGATSSMTTAMG